MLDGSNANSAGIKGSPCSPPSPCGLVNHIFLVFTIVWKGVRRTGGQKGGVCRQLASSGLRSSLPFAKLSRTPPHHRWTTLWLWGFCLWQLALRVRCSHTPPWLPNRSGNGFVAVSNLAMNCLAMVLATSRLMTSPTAIHHSSVRLLQWNHLPNSSCGENLGLGERLSSFMEHAAIHVVQERAQMFCPRAGWPPAAPRRAVFKYWRNSLCPTRKVWLEPSNAQRAVEISPILINPLLDSVHPGATPSGPQTCEDDRGAGSWGCCHLVAVENKSWFLGAT